MGDLQGEPDSRKRTGVVPNPAAYAEIFVQKQKIMPWSLGELPSSISAVSILSKVHHRLDHSKDSGTQQRHRALLPGRPSHARDDTSVAPSHAPTSVPSEHSESLPGERDFEWQRSTISG